MTKTNSTVILNIFVKLKSSGEMMLPIRFLTRTRTTTECPRSVCSLPIKWLNCILFVLFDRLQLCFHISNKIATSFCRSCHYFCDMFSSHWGEESAEHPLLRPTGAGYSSNLSIFVSNSLCLTGSS